MNYPHLSYIDLPPIYYKDRMGDPSPSLHSDLAAPLTASKISIMSVLGGIQSAVTAAIAGGAIPAIPLVPLWAMPLVGLALNAGVLYVRKQIQSRAQKELASK